jgi:hypothetical protein
VGVLLVVLAAGIYGALYCMADLQTEFVELSAQLKEVAELLGTCLMRALGGGLAGEYGVSGCTGQGLG